jgi:signal peptidase I
MATRGSKSSPAGRRTPKSGSSALGYLQSFGVALLLALVFRQFIAQAFRIPSESMVSTLLVGDFLFVNKFLYGAQVPFTDRRLPTLRAPRRGDIIVFKSPTDGRDFIKRCVGVAGDTVVVRAKQLYVNGQPAVEPFVQHLDPGVRPPGDRRDFYGPHVVRPGHFFMMGDNRDNSQDSRYWGDLDVRAVKGKAMFIYFSTDVRRKYPVSFWVDVPFFRWRYTGYFPPWIRFSRMMRIIH